MIICALFVLSVFFIALMVFVTARFLAVVMPLGLFELCFNLVTDVDVALLAYKLMGLWAVGKYGDGDRGVVVGEEVTHNSACGFVAVD